MNGSVQGFVDRGRRRSRHAGRIGVGTLAEMLFAIFVTQRDRHRTGPVVDRRAVDGEAEGFLAHGLDRRRSNGGAAGAVLAVEIGDLAGGQGGAEGIERHAAIGLGDGVAADDLAGRVEHRILRQVEAREVAVRAAGAARQGCTIAAHQWRARQRHIVDLDAGVVFAVGEIRIPAPGLAEQVELAVAADRSAAHGAGDEHELVGGDIRPVGCHRRC